MKVNYFQHIYMILNLTKYYSNMMTKPYEFTNIVAIIIINVVTQVSYFVVDSPRNEGKDYFEINKETGEVFTKIVFDREKQGAYALEVEARDGAPSARPNNDNAPNSGINHDVKYSIVLFINIILILYC